MGQRSPSRPSYINLSWIHLLGPPLCFNPLRTSLLRIFHLGWSSWMDQYNFASVWFGSFLRGSVIYGLHFCQCLFYGRTHSSMDCSSEISFTDMFSTALRLVRLWDNFPPGNLFFLGSIRVDLLWIWSSRDPFLWINLIDLPPMFRF